MEVHSYTTRPDQIEAVQLSRENIEELAVWCGGDIIREPKSSDPSDVYLALTVPRVNGPLDAQIGDFVIKNARGRFEIKRADIFVAMYGRSATLSDAADKLVKAVEDQLFTPEQMQDAAFQTVYGRPRGTTPDTHFGRSVQ